MKSKKIVVAGLICVDATPSFSGSQKVEHIGDLLKPGKLLNIGAMTNSVGGAVPNTGLAMKKFGSDMVLIAKIAKDSYGQVIQQVFDSYDAGQHLTCAEGETTAYTLVIAPPGIDRTFLHHPGANASFGYDDLDFDLIGQCDHFHFGYPTLMRKMYLNGGEETLRVFRKVKELGLTTSLDMAAIEDGSEASKEDWKEIIRKLMPYVDFFVPSIEELGYMMDRGLYDQWNERAAGKDVTSVLDLEKDVKPLADTLIEWGAKCVLIKCGARGMYLKTAPAKVMNTLAPAEAAWKEEEKTPALTEAASKEEAGFAGPYYTWDNLSIFEKSYVPDRILSGTGAGDTSIAAFLKAALDGYSAQRCLQFATAAGASCITEYDTLSGLLSFDEMTAKIDAGWEKNQL